VAGMSTAFSSSVSIGPARLYLNDLAVLLIFARGALPRPRSAAPRALAGLPQAFFLLWLGVLAFAAVRSRLDGIPSPAIIRGDLTLFYWPLLYFGFSRVLAETDLRVKLLWRNLALVAVGFAMYMFIARALNHPFNDPGLAQVPTGPNETIPRNYGFASAFVIYPVLAIAGVAVMANIREHRLRSTALALIGAVATLTTLVRGEIFSLALGILLVIWASPARLVGTGRMRTALQLGFASAAALLLLFAVQPRLGHAIVQRSLPFTRQAEAATVNVDYRFEAMSTGIDTARAHPFGLGVLDVESLSERGIDPGFMAHSGFGTLLIVGGWPALVTAVLALLFAVQRSFQRATAARWLHAGFVGAIVMLAAYSFGAAGLAGDPWVIPLGALAVALRFGIPPERS
jgi:hypothetical protein